MRLHAGARLREAGEQYLLIKSPPASGKSRALMFVALDKLKNQGFEADHHRCAGEVHRCQLQRRAAVDVGFLGLTGRSNPVEPVQRARQTTMAARLSRWAFLEGDDKVLVCTHATFRFAVDAWRRGRLRRPPDRCR